MSPDNQTISFVKWFLKWFAIVTLGLVLLALAIWGIADAYQYLMHDRHIKKVEVVVFDGSVHATDEVLRQHPDINAEELVKIFFDSGRDAYTKERNNRIKNMGWLEESKIRRALTYGIYAEMQSRVRVALPEIEKMRNLNSSEGSISNYKSLLGLTDEMLEDSDALLALEIPSSLCSTDTPLYVGYKNSSPKTIEWIEIRLSGFLPDRSSNILEWGAKFESDYIAEPGEADGKCIDRPVKDDYREHFRLDEARYEGKIQFIRFQD